MIQELDACRDISIYLGNGCNFSCSYCDRDYIKHSIGGQRMSREDIPDILAFLRHIEADTTPPDTISFHGGEPLSYVEVMDEIIAAIVEVIPTAAFFVQTNGSLISKNEQFFERWGDRLTVSISYDFHYQVINRTTFDIKGAVELLKRCGVENIQYQYVMPIHDSKVFSFDAIKSITSVCYSSGVNSINLIPLRHMRGGDKFEIIVDKLDLPQFFDAFIKFIQILYVMGISVTIDGHVDDVDKHYFDNHKQLVLSPDGMIYPEYDFLEYKRAETVIGSWRAPIVIARSGVVEDELIHKHCTTCPVRSNCGLKFLYRLFNTDPTTSKCAQFYFLLNTVIKHNQKLKQQKSIFHWVGI